MKGIISAAWLLIVTMAVMSGQAMAGVAADNTDCINPIEVAAGFFEYVARQPDVDSGLPSLEHMPVLSRWISTDLATEIENARRQRQIFMAHRPDDKPPLIEGSLFSSLFEGFSGLDGVRLHGAVVHDGQGRKSQWLTVDLRIENTGSMDVFRWHDRVALVCESGAAGTRWYIDDIEYRGDWDFSNGQGTRLRQVLDIEFPNVL